MAWLSLLLFLPWFAVLGGLYWWFPRQPRGRSRQLFDGSVLMVALLLSIVAMHHGYALGIADAQAGAIWRQVLSVLYAYGAFLAIISVAILLRPRVLRY